MKKVIFVFALLLSLAAHSQEFNSNKSYTGKWNNQTSDWDFSESKEINSIISIKDSSVYIDDVKRVTLTSPSIQSPSKNYKGTEWCFSDELGQEGIMIIAEYISGRKTITFHYEGKLYAYYIQQK
jgi:hypothetical protein